MNRYMPEGMLIKTEKNYEYLSSKEGLLYALEHGLILEYTVTMCDHAFNLHIDLPSGIKGIIPRAEVLYSEEGEGAKDIAILTRVGKACCFKVLGLRHSDSGEDCAILSRRAAQGECKREFINGLTSGDIIPARVTHIESFGAFVDIGCGLISLLSIDSISVSRISSPALRLYVGQSIYVVIKAIDDRGRIYVSMRELLGTWEENASRFSEGETVVGRVRSVENYGIFVELMPNLAGLAEYRDGVEPGDSASVYIKSILPEKMKLKLIIIDTQKEIERRSPIEYFTDIEKCEHIDSWTYSPKGSKRKIESIF